MDQPLNENADEPKDSVFVRIVKGMTLSAAMLFMIGTCFGLPALAPVMSESGLFSSYCTNGENHTQCLHLSQQKISRANTISFGVMEALAIFFAIFLDLSGVKLWLWISPLIWIASVTLMGVAPEQGWVFYVGFVLSVLTTFPVYFGVLGDIATAISPKQFPSLMSCILTGFWDLGAITYLIIALIRENFFPDTPIWQIFFSYGVVIGLPLFILFQLFWPIWKPEKREIPDLKQQVIDMKTYLTTPLFWLLSLHLGWLYIYNYFFLPVVMQHMAWHGADYLQSKEYLYHWSIMLPCLGFPASMLTGFAVDYGNKPKMVGIYCVEAFLPVIIALTACLPSTPLWVQYITFTLFIFWRMIGISSYTALIPCLYPDLQYGTAMGVSSSFSGLVGFIVTPFLNKVVFENPDNFLVMHLVFCVVASLIAVAIVVHFSIEIFRTRQSSNNKNFGDGTTTDGGGVTDSDFGRDY